MMGVVFTKMNGYFNFMKGEDISEHPRQVFNLALTALTPIIESGLPKNLSHVVVATSCPDSIAPSLGQMISEKFNSLLSGCHILDIVQGCAGGVTAIILGSQLSEMNKTPVLVIQADAANKAASRSKEISKNFGNGSYACLISPANSGKGLLHFKSQHYEGLSDVVTINLGHDADELIKKHGDIKTDPRKYLGLSMDNDKAIKLFRNAESFYKEFVEESSSPDLMILHQVNPAIIRRLKKVFEKYNLDFIDVAELTGNCGAASVGIALNMIKDKIEGKKIMLCSFGTGGVITGGLWQN